MAHQFNFKQIFSAELKAEIIEKRTKKYVEKFGMSERDARKRAKSEMMSKRDYTRFARVADYICYKYNIPTDTDHISISTNRYGGHSWYIKYEELEIRLSDHDSNHLRDNTICLFPLEFSFEYIKGFLQNSIHFQRSKNEVDSLVCKISEVTSDMGRKIEQYERLYGNLDTIMDLRLQIEQYKEATRNLGDFELVAENMCEPERIVYTGHLHECVEYDIRDIECLNIYIRPKK